MRRSAVLSYLLLAVLGLLAIVATRMLGGREKMSTATDAGLTSGGQTSVPATSPPPVAAILEQTGGTGREQETGRQTQVVRSEPPQQSATDALGATPETLALRKKYDGLSYEELDLKARELEHLLDELSFPVFDEYLMLGKYQAVGVGQQYTAESWDSSELTDRKSVV